MKKVTFILIAIIAISTLYTKVSAQGCVALRGSGASYMQAHPGQENEKSWLFTSSMRYFRSYKHYSGTTENVARLTDGSAVINHQATIDLSLTRVFDNRWSLLIDLPIQSNARSSLYEHGLVNGAYIKKERHTTHAFGLADARAAVYRWMLDPTKHANFNIQLGVGIKFATGDYNVKDYWYNVGPGGTKELRPLDQSVQLGDGGTGFTVEANTFKNFSKHFSGYGNFYYLLNPAEQNGTRTYRETLTPALANEAICSVPDQYMARIGANYTAKGGFSASLGGRIEGIPVHDLVGGSGDFRRPGFVISAEPGVNYAVKKVNLFASVPVALVRNRLQSVTDKENSIKNGKFVRGDAAFADYVVNLGISIKF
jgi:hypothetical protein